MLFDPDSPLRARRAVVCVDDEAGRAMAARAGDAITVSAEGRPADWRAVDVAPMGAGGQQFTAVDPAAHGIRSGFRLPGHYNVANCLVALALLDAVGVSPEQAAPGLRQTRVPGRMEEIDVGQDFLALVDYAHKPGALRAVLTTLSASGPSAGGGVRRRWRARSGQTGADGRDGRRAGRLGRRHRRQPAR